MARDLDQKDKEILLKLLPEMEPLVKKGVDLEYMNVLPPVANHHSRNPEEFRGRLKNLSSEDLKYLADKILSEEESLGCLDPDFAEVFILLLDSRVSSDISAKVREAYEEGGGACG